jgi:hypothetical protein
MKRLPYPVRLFVRARRPNARRVLSFDEAREWRRVITLGREENSDGERVVTMEEYLYWWESRAFRVGPPPCVTARREPRVYFNPAWERVEL